MKNLYTSLCLWLTLCVAAITSATDATAQTYFADDFAYTPGDLRTESAGKWMRAKSYSANPIQVVEGELSVDGCPLSASQNVVKIVNSYENECLMAQFDLSDRGVSQGSIYYAALVNVTKAPSKLAHFLSLAGRSMVSDVSEGNIPAENGRVFVGPGSTDGTFRFGVNLGSGTPKALSGDLELGTTHLVVARLDIGVSSGKDCVSFYVDPESYTEEPATAVGSHTSYGVSNGYGYKAIELSQQLSYGETAGEIYVGALRVADTYAALFAAGEEEKPEISATGAEFQYAFDGVSYEGQINVKGTNLKGDITAACSNADIVLETTTIAAADALGENGATLKFTLTPAAGESDEQTATVTLSSEGAEPQTATIKWAAIPTTIVNEVKEFASADPESYAYLLFKGQAIVSYVDKSTSPVTFYLQDANGGVQFKDEWAAMSNMNFDEGDSIGNFVVVAQASLGVNYIVPAVDQNIRITSTHNSAKATVATIAEIKASPATYVNRLVRVRKVTLSGFDEGAVFAEGMSQPTFTDENAATGKVRIFKGTNLIGETIPTEQIDLIGILTSKAVTNGPIVAPRYKADLAEVAGPSLTLSTEQFLSARGKVGETTTVGTVHVSAAFQDAPITIQASSAVEGIYTTDVTELPAGESDLDITISYTPTAVGKNNGYIYFMQGEDILATIRVNGMAIDPANPPSLQISPSSFNEFTAAVGSEAKQTLTITPVGMPDYVKVVLEQGSSMFTTSTSLLATSGTQTVTVTFDPVAEGTYEATLTLSNEFIDPITFTLTGVATPDESKEEIEGDELKLSTENPLTLLNEGFSAGTHNAPLSLEGWTNVAVVGTRAWWGYTFPDYSDYAGEQAAKVTGYDSDDKYGTSDDAQMLLITPALDFKNSASQMFTFRVMGENLTDDMTDKLKLCYVYVSNGNVYAQSLESVVMPASKDESGEWVDFQVDLAGQQLDDVFFMGFYYETKRGCNTSAVYYIDDVTYGRTDLPLITPQATELTFGVAPGNKQTQTVSISGANLTDDVELTLVGSDKDMFSLSTSALPVAGGTVDVTFDGFVEGTYAAQLKLTSRGAATKYINLSATAQTGIAQTMVEGATSVQVFDVTGRKLSQTDGQATASVISQLPAGTYVVTITRADGSKRSMKISR